MVDLNIFFFIFNVCKIYCVVFHEMQETESWIFSEECLSFWLDAFINNNFLI